MARLTRRRFLQGTGAAAVATLLTAGAGRTAPVVPAAPGAAGRQELIPTVCGMCDAGCLLTATVAGGKVVRLEGSAGNPVNGSALCARGHAAVKLLTDPDRLKYPLKRVGPRGSGRWTRIDWGEAIDTISLHMEKALNRLGPKGLALFAGGSSSAYIQELFQEFSISQINVSGAETCRRNRDLAYRLTFGLPPGDPPRLDYRRAGAILLLGSHLGENLAVPEQQRLGEALARGAKLVVADPRFSAVAARADLYLPIRPGTDTALLLGWINLLVAEGRYAPETVSRLGQGFAELRQQAARYPLERVAALTGLDVDQIRRAGLLLAEQAPAVIVHPGRHSAWYGNDLQQWRARAVFTGLLGAWGAAGGILPPAALPATGGHESTTAYEANLAAVRRAMDHNDPALPGRMIKKMEQGDIAVVGCWGQNPFQAHPDPYRTMRALAGVEFVFACDLLPSEATLYADIVLPEASFLERSDVLTIRQGVEKMVVASRLPVKAPAFEVKDPYWIVRQLSIRLGRGGGFSFQDGTARLEHELARFGLSLAGLRRQGGYAQIPLPAQEPSPSDSFPTPSNKMEFSSRILSQAGQAAVPVFTPVAEPPPGFFRLLYGRTPLHTGSSTQNNPWLHQEMPANELWLNDQVARAMGLAPGEEVMLQNQEGISSMAPVRLRITPGIRPDCLYLVHGFGSRSRRLRLAYNQGVSDSWLMTRSVRDPVTAARGLRNTFVRLVRPEAGHDR